MKKDRRRISYAIEFVKFSTGFAVIIALALLSLHVAVAAQ